MDEPGESAGESILREPVTDESSDGLFTQEVKWNLPRRPTCLKIELELKEWMIGDVKLGRSICGDRQQSRAAHSREDVAEHVHCRHVGPVNVLDEKHERLLRGDLPEERRELALHALLRLR